MFRGEHMSSLLQRSYQSQAIRLELQKRSALPEALLHKIPQTFVQTHFQDEPTLVIDACNISTEGYFRTVLELLSLCGQQEPTPYETADQYKERLTRAGIELAPPRRVLIYGKSIQIVLDFLGLNQQQLRMANV